MKTTIFVLFLCLFFIGGSVWAFEVLPGIPDFGSLILLPKTGQTNCFDQIGKKVPCLGTGQDGEYQIGLPVTGERFVENENGIIFDRATNLSWQKCSKGQILPNCSGNTTTSNWRNALSYCNDLDSLGREWRLPNRNELASIMNLSGIDPTIDSKFFPNTPSVYYWSSTSYEQIPTSAWAGNFGNGQINFNVKTLSNYVRCVK